MRYDEFERRASEVWEEIPDVYRSGVDGLVLERRAEPHPSLPEIYTLGECRTESYPSDWGGPDTVRSVLVLYYGSFEALSELDPEFDWRYEIWETVTHELRHHLEWLAAEDDLEDVDFAMDENFKRLHGEPFDPFFFRYGEPVGEGVYEAEREVFIERPYDAGAAPTGRVRFEWDGRPHSVEVPARLGDVAFLQVVDGIDLGAYELCVVLVRRRGWWAQLKAFLTGSSPEVVEAEVTARPER